MELSPVYKKLVDHRNEDLWASVNKNNLILLCESMEPNYMANFKPNVITLYIDHNNINPASFTHELLHIFLKDKGIHVADAYNNLILENDTLFLIFSKELRDHIGNCLEHIKMRPLYLERGFEGSKFNSDYAEKK